MTVIYSMSIDRADKPWIGDRRFSPGSLSVLRQRQRSTQRNGVARAAAWAGARQAASWYDHW